MSRTLCHMTLVGLVLLLAHTLPLTGQQYGSSTEIVGGEGGSAFADQLPQSGARVVEVQINAGNYVDSVQIVLALPDGQSFTAPRHGGSGGRRNTFRLDSGEYIVGISGRADFQSDLRAANQPGADRGRPRRFPLHRSGNGWWSKDRGDPHPVW
jgi:Jacalin-like lectin domain